jgi:peptide/nickel transport system permease protein
MVVLVVLAMTSWLGFTPYDPAAQNAAVRLQGPSAAHLFGTDIFGRDIFSRSVAGLANSLRVALLAVAAAGTVGVMAGLLGGFYRGAVDAVSGGIANILFAFPPLLLALTLASVLERTWVTVALAIAVVYVPIFYRVTRGPVLSLREREFVKAAVSTGQRPIETALKHVLPNVSGLVVVQVALSLSWAVLTEAALSFLGLGTPPPAPSLGSMIFEAKNTVLLAPWTLYAPGIVVVVLVAALNLVGDALRDALDPREEGR